MKIKKILFLMVVTISLFWLPKVKASNKYSLVRENYENIYYVQNGMPDHYGSDIQFKFALNGKTAFCMDPIAPITKYEYNGIPLRESTYDAETQNYLNKVIYYGYDYPGHQTERYYMATQALIWEKISNYLIEFYTERYGYGEYIDVSTEKNEIINLINNYNYLPSFANNTYNYNPTNYLEFEDSNLNNFEIEQSNWNDVAIENNKLKIKNLQNFVGTINIKLKKKMYRTDTPMYYYEDGSQAMITGGELDNIETSLSININGAKIKVNKLDNTSNLPIKNSNIKFNIINTITNEYVYVNGTKNIPINSDGYLITEALPYGEYEIKEVATANEYELSQISFLVEVNQNTVKENNIYEFNFYNALKKGNINISKIDKDSKKPIAGVEFGLYALRNIRSSDGVLHYSQNQLVETGITNNDGKLTFNNLIYGDYYLKELNTITGYSVDNTSHKVSLKNKETNITIENRLEKVGITIKKYGQVFDKDIYGYDLIELENVEYKLIANKDIVAPEGTVYYRKGDTVAIKKTDKDGMIYFNDLVIGDYCFIETKTLDEYQIDKNMHCYDLKYGLYTEEINYLKRGNLKLSKLDKDSGLPIKKSNIKFQIKNMDTNQYIYVGDTNKLDLNSEGLLIVNNLLYGTYEISEIMDNPMYEVNNEPLIVEINASTIDKDDFIYINVYNSLKKGSISVLKNGEKLNFKTGTYAPIKLEGIEFSLIANEDISTYDLGTIYSKGDVVEIKTTNKNGKTEFNNLILGSYCLKETKTLDNYVLDDNYYCFDLMDNNIQTIELTNYLKKGNLKLNKLDKESKLPIENSNIKFQIKNLDTNRYIYINDSKDLVINDYGYLSIDNLPYGKYEIKEISTNDNYLINKEPMIVELNDSTINIDNNTLEVNFFNEKKLGKITVNKKGEVFNYKNQKYNYKPLKQVEFTLMANKDIITGDGVKHYNNGDIVATNITDIDGQLVFDNLILGSYCLKETKTLDNYVLDDNYYCFDLMDNNIQTIELTNYLKKGNLKLNKLDKESKLPIENSNIKFQIKNLDTNRYIYINDSKDLVINDYGYLSIDNLPYGKYEIKEISTNDNYLINKELMIVELNDSTINVENNTLEVNFFNEKKLGKITVNKKGEVFNYKSQKYNYKPLKQVEFALIANKDIITGDGIKHYNNGDIVATNITDIDGQLVFDNLILGSYCLKETKTKDGYIIDENSYCFNLTEKNNQEITLTNYLEKGNLKIIKIDNITKEPIKGVTFEIYSDNNFIGKFKTDKNGIIELNDIPNYIYKIKEIKAANQYILDDEIYTIDLKQKNEIIIENQKKVILPNTKLNDYTLIISSSIILVGLFLYKYGHKNEEN